MRNPAVDAYIARAPEEARATLEELRRLIRKSLPMAAESFGPNGREILRQIGKRSVTRR